MPHPGAELHSCRVVIADDDFLIRHLLRTITGEHCEVVGEAENGKHAVDLTHELHPHIVLLDISMPVLNGFEAAEIIRNELPEIRIIIVSSHADRAYIERAFEIGARGYVVKEFAFSDLPQALEKVFQNLTYRSA